MLKLALGDLLLQVVDGLEQSPHFLRVHLLNSFQLLLTASVAFLEFLILSLEFDVLSLDLVMLLFEHVDQLVFGLVLAQLHVYISQDSLSLSVARAFFD